eukprot:scaffold87614_cov21-Tisochrysis_lutea.AAC.1
MTATWDTGPFLCQAFAQLAVTSESRDRGDSPPLMCTCEPGINIFYFDHGFQFSNHLHRHERWQPLRMSPMGAEVTSC